MLNTLLFLAAAAVPLQHTMTIDPKERALDYKEAFEALRKEKGAGKVHFDLVNGETIGNIIEMNISANGHLVIFKYGSGQAIRHQVVPIEQIAALQYTP